MGLIELIVVLIFVGVLLFCLNTALASIIDPKILTLINVVVLLVVVVWLLRVMGVLTGLSQIRVGP